VVDTVSDSSREPVVDIDDDADTDGASLRDTDPDRLVDKVGVKESVGDIVTEMVGLIVSDVSDVTVGVSDSVKELESVALVLYRVCVKERERVTLGLGVVEGVKVFECAEAVLVSERDTLWLGDRV
jgi:hypothetical protein